MLTEKDIKQLEDQGLTITQVYKQIEKFTTGIPYANIVTTASVGNGIQQFSYKQQQQFEAYYDKKKNSLDIVKFIPASGAATRMFKFLHQFLAQFDPEQTLFRDYLKEHKSEDLITFFSSTAEFPFINKVRKTIREKYPDYKQSSKGQRHSYFVKAMLDSDGLNYSNMPKGLIPFHKYKKYATTAFEEQLFETAYYASVKEDVYLHFTFSELHLPYFKEEFNNIKKRVSRKTKKKFHISYSFQKKSTDTIAVTLTNQPYRNQQGKLVFRPSGHGALLDNLNDINADVIFIKNIDNVAVQEYVEEIAASKRVLAGRLLWLQQKIFGYLKKLEGEVTLEDMKGIQSFMWNELDIKKDIPKGISAVKEFLNRPLRVCGVVKNTGAPGGGPYWVLNDDGSTSLQIIEASQIDKKNSHQLSISKEATHFNPVDIVCGVRNYKGEKFDLTAYSDPFSGFISEKSENGTPIKALELPGLWNGAMANWITIFVEVPLITFNPVKTVNDLLKKEHRPNA